jgi:hypothetical protein
VCLDAVEVVYSLLWSRFDAERIFEGAEILLLGTVDVLWQSKVCLQGHQAQVPEYAKTAGYLSVALVLLSQWSP